MDELLQLLTDGAGGLVRVIYSVTLEEPHHLQKVGLTFEVPAVAVGR